VSILQEIGIIPAVFDPTNYDSLRHQQAAFCALLPRLMETSFLRIPHAGEWKATVSSTTGSSEILSKVVETLFKENRVFADNIDCKQIKDWLERYQLSHKRCRLSGVILDDLSERLTDNPPTSQISEIGFAKWWTEQPDIVLRGRDEHAMVDAFGELLRRASRFDFIDPHLDPSDRRYLRFCRLVRELNHNPNKPRIVFHTSLKVIFRAETAESAFSQISNAMIPAGKTADVYIWDYEDLPDKFHDRFLLTDLIGIQLGRGFESSPRVDNNAFIIPRATAQRVSEVFRNDVNSRFEPIFVLPIGVPNTRGDLGYRGSALGSSP
jgi:hypothetical protein